MSRRGMRRTIHLLLRKVNRSIGHRNLVSAPSEVTEVCRRVCNKVRRSTKIRLVGAFAMRDDRVIVRGSVAFCSAYRRRLLPFCKGTRVTCVPSKGIMKLDGLTHAIRMFTEQLRLRRRLAKRVTSTLVRCVRPGNTLIVIRTRRVYVAVHKVGGPKDRAIALTQENIFRASPALRREFFHVLKEWEVHGKGRIGELRAKGCMSIG